MSNGTLLSIILNQGTVLLQPWLTHRRAGLDACQRSPFQVTLADGQRVTVQRAAEVPLQTGRFRQKKLSYYILPAAAHDLILGLDLKGERWHASKPALLANSWDMKHVDAPVSRRMLAG